MFEGSSADLLEGDYLDEELSDKSSRLTAMTQDAQVRQRYDIVSRTGYEKSQRGNKDGLANKINSVVREGEEILNQVFIIM